MPPTPTPVPNEYVTSDIGFAAYVTVTHTWKFVKATLADPNGTVEFIFTSPDRDIQAEVERVESAYFQNSAEVPARAYLNAIREVKLLIYRTQKKLR
jgi:hypothetical protein